MIGTIGSIGANIYQNYRDSQLSAASTSRAMSFDDLLSNGVISTKEEPTMGVESITAVPTLESTSSSASSVSSNGSNSDMDLNKDGQVTSDEIIRYLQMQMVDRIAEELTSEEGTNMMNQQAQQQTGMDEFKNKLAKTAYKLGETLIDTAKTSVSYSFIL